MISGQVYVIAGPPKELSHTVAIYNKFTAGFEPLAATRTKALGELCAQAIREKHADLLAKLADASTREEFNGTVQPLLDELAGFLLNEMIQVQSSNISAIGFIDESLVVQFTNGGRYRYLGVPVQVFYDFMASESKGRFFAEFVKGEYNYVLVGS